MKRLLLFLSILVFPLLGQTATPPPAVAPEHPRI
jgi:hypothetical protein